MSEEQENKTLGTVVVDEENFGWDELEANYQQVNNDLVDLSLLITEMIKQNSAAIDGSDKLTAMVHGLVNTVGDVTNELNDIKASYYNENCVGPIAKEDEANTMVYIESIQKYMACLEKVTALTLTALTDIMIEVKADESLIKEAAELSMEQIDGK